MSTRTQLKQVLSSRSAVSCRHTTSCDRGETDACTGHGYYRQVGSITCFGFYKETLSVPHYLFALKQRQFALLSPNDTACISSHVWPTYLDLSILDLYRLVQYNVTRLSNADKEHDCIQIYIYRSYGNAF